MRKFFNSFLFAFKGLIVSFTLESNLKVQLTAALIVAGAGFYFGITAIEWCIILLTIGLVLGMELVNTAIEKTVDLITLERHPLAGKIKDIAAGAVLLVSIASCIVGAIIFWKYLF